MREFNKVRVLLHLLFLQILGAATLVCVFLLAVVVPSRTGNASALSAPKVVAFVGESVLLPCNITPTGDVPTVEWIKEGLFPDIAFLYRDGCETFEMKNRVFQYRTMLIRHELHNGNLSLLISNLQPNDRGTYQCVIRRNNQKEVIARLELVVGAVSEPRLSVVRGMGGGLTLQCEARCWFPEPRITLFDNQGNEMSAEDPRRHEDSLGCLTVKRKVTLQTAANRVTCRVHQPELNQTRRSEICIPDACTRSCTGLAVVCSVASFGVAISFFFLVKKPCCSGEEQRSCVKGETIKEQAIEIKPSTAMMTPGESPNDSASSQGISDLIFPPAAESLHINNNTNPKPEATTSSSPSISNSLSETRGEDSGPPSSAQRPAPNPSTKRCSQDSSSAFSTNSSTLPTPSPHSKDECPPCSPNVVNVHRKSSVRSQRRSNNSPESEPLIG